VLPARSIDKFTGPPGVADQLLGRFSLPPKGVISARGSERRDHEVLPCRLSARNAICPSKASDTFSETEEVR
jgi:hypothetical protein